MIPATTEGFALEQCVAVTHQRSLVGCWGTELDRRIGLGRAGYCEKLIRIAFVVPGVYEGLSLFGTRSLSGIPQAAFRPLQLRP